MRNDGFPTEKEKKILQIGFKKKGGKKDTNQTTEEQHDATGDATNFGVNFIKKPRKKKDKAIDHMDCDPLTVGFLHTALHIKDFIFNKK